MKTLTQDEKLSDTFKRSIDRIVKPTHFKDSKVAEILGIKQTTYKTIRCKKQLRRHHYDTVVSYFESYNKLIKLIITE